MWQCVSWVFQRPRLFSVDQSINQVLDGRLMNPLSFLPALCSLQMEYYVITWNSRPLNTKLSVYSMCVHAYMFPKCQYGYLRPTFSDSAVIRVSSSTVHPRASDRARTPLTTSLRWTTSLGQEVPQAKGPTRSLLIRRRGTDLRTAPARLAKGSTCRTKSKQQSLKVTLTY